MDYDQQSLARPRLGSQSLGQNTGQGVVGPPSVKAPILTRSILQCPTLNGSFISNRSQLQRALLRSGPWARCSSPSMQCRLRASVPS